MSGASVLQQYIAELQLPISGVRLESYRPTASSNDLEMVATYLWNAALSEALFPALQGVEIALRNSISAGMSDRFGTEAWYDHPGILGLAQQRAVQRAKRDVFAAKGSVRPGRVIAELHFWFWTSLLSQLYHRNLWEPDQFALIDAVFPHVPKRHRNRRKIHQRYNAIRGLRNRVFHFEPLWNEPSLQQDHADILDGIGWISPAMQSTVSLYDRFDSIFIERHLRFEDVVRKHLSI